MLLDRVNTCMGHIILCTVPAASLSRMQARGNSCTHDNPARFPSALPPLIQANKRAMVMAWGQMRQQSQRIHS